MTRVTLMSEIESVINDRPITKTTDQHSDLELLTPNHLLLMKQICLCSQYSKSRKTGSGHAADSKLRYTIHMLCAKYQEASLGGSREKCDRIFL